MTEQSLICTSVKCWHGKIPYGGHCAWVDCENYRSACPVHITYPPKTTADSK